jgi:hypothetical protein
MFNAERANYATAGSASIAISPSISRASSTG